jgi:hypothetical protein
MHSEFYQIGIVVAILIAGYFYWRNEKLKEKIKDLSGTSGGVPSTVSQFRSQQNAEEPQLSIPEDESAKPEANPEEEKKEYNYRDPKFGMPPLASAKRILGREENKFGDAVYGRDSGYDSNAYIGRVSRGAELELLDRRIYKNEFEIDIIKVKVLSNEWATEVGQTVWLGLNDTSFRSLVSQDGSEIQEPSE